MDRQGIVGVLALLLGGCASAPRPAAESLFTSALQARQAQSRTFETEDR